MKIAIINGPNLNLLGSREPGVYGTESFESYFEKLQKRFPSASLEYFQSNVEGEIINLLHTAATRCDALILNAGGYSHTSIAIADAVGAIRIPVVGVHISNIYAREEYRHTDLVAGKCKGVITGFGLESYRLALESFNI